MVPQTVLLYGGSLLVSLVANGLDQCADLRVIHVPTWNEATRWLSKRMPDVLIFDLTDEHEGHLLSLLLKNPQLLLIALDPEHNQGLLLSAHEAQSLTLGQIREIIGGVR